MTPSEQSYREISLTRGQVALVDAEDFERLSRYKWYARWGDRMQAFYAYRNIPIDGSQASRAMHNEVLNIPYGSDLEGDHIDQSKTLDNRKSNLRKATRSQQCANRRLWKKSKSGYKGVHLMASRPNLAIAHIRVNGKRIYLGTFNRSAITDAARAYDEAAKKYFGEFACLNFPAE